MIASIAGRIARNPKKYFSAEFWRITVPELRFRLRERALFDWPFRLGRAAGPRVYIFPSPMNKFQPAETYMAWKALRMRRARLVQSPEEADLALAWHPSTSYTLDPELVKHVPEGVPILNGRCTDIRKSTVGVHFRKVFGYSLDVDPSVYSGVMVRKSERNGAHDARLLQGPIENAGAGWIYQRLVSYPTPLGLLEWRVFIVGAKPVAVYRLYAKNRDRFNYHLEEAEPAQITSEFSETERAAITAFNESIGLDFGVLDVLRDKADGRIYICDCNNTATGPLQSMPFLERIRVMRTVCNAFKREYLTNA